MIATILPSSTNFHAVEYNERKVAKGQAVLLEMKNFGYVGAADGYTPEQLQQYLIDYSARNEHIRKSQFHVAISCRGHEYSQEQLLDIAHQYLHEMDYDDEGQPLLIYAHNDTDNNHLHIITSRVNPNGQKIDHSHERIRSQEAINKIVGEDEELRADLFLKEAPLVTISIRLLNSKPSWRHPAMNVSSVTATSKLHVADGYEQK